MRRLDAGLGPVAAKLICANPGCAASVAAGCAAVVVACVSVGCAGLDAAVVVVLAGAVFVLFPVVVDGGSITIVQAESKDMMIIMQARMAIFLLKPFFIFHRPYKIFLC